jgi:hypothetical protein
MRVDIDKLEALLESERKQYRYPPSLIRYDEMADLLVTRETALMEALGMDRTWPLVSVLEKLIEAHDHFMQRHDCDGHGYEVWNTAAAEGRRIAIELARALSGEQGEQE